MRWILGNVHYIRLHKKVIRQNPLWLWNQEETSPEIQNRGTSGPKKSTYDFIKHQRKKTIAWCCNSNLHLIRRKIVPTNDLELIAPNLYIYKIKTKCLKSVESMLHICCLYTHCFHVNKKTYYSHELFVSIYYLEPRYHEYDTVTKTDGYCTVGWSLMRKWILQKASNSRDNLTVCLSLIWFCTFISRL